MVGDMAQPLSVLAALKKNLSYVPSTHIEWHTTICNSHSTGSGTLSWPL